MPLKSVKPRDFILDPSLVFYADLSKKDGTSFISDDAYGHLCTVTGATWGSHGRTFDGTDDKISIPHNVAFSFERTNSFSILARINSDVPTSGDIIISKKMQAGGLPHSYAGYSLQLAAGPVLRLDLVHESGVSSCQVAGSTVIAASTNYFVVATYNGSSAPSGIVLYVNGVAETLTTVTDNLTDTIITTAALNIGTYDGLDVFWDGLVGDVWIYNRVLMLAEIQHIWQITKWRYL